jgi:hypothetical protein
VPTRALIQCRQFPPITNTSGAEPVALDTSPICSVFVPRGELAVAPLKGRSPDGF